MEVQQCSSVLFGASVRRAAALPPCKGERRGRQPVVQKGGSSGEAWSSRILAVGACLRPLLGLQDWGGGGDAGNRVVQDVYVSFPH